MSTQEQPELERAVDRLRSRWPVSNGLYAVHVKLDLLSDVVTAIAKALVPSKRTT